jgi:hypothetical protein
MKTQKRKIPSDVTFTIDVEFDDLPVRGNAMASGDAEVDKEVEDEIIARLDRGDVWAWALVIVRAHWHDFEGRAALGGCSYKDAQDFKAPDGYYPQMCEEAFADLIVTLKETTAHGRDSTKLLSMLKKGNRL